MIFPEGTRSRDGRPKTFKPSGLKTLIKKAPSALIVPITINNSWKLLRFGQFPMGLGSYLKFKVQEPIPIEGDIEALVKKVEHAVIKDLVY